MDRAVPVPTNGIGQKASDEGCGEQGSSCLHQSDVARGPEIRISDLHRVGMTAR
jgi:hypothetical protein